MRLLFALLAFLGFTTAASVQAATPQQTAETTWRLLDYIAVDYAGAVDQGRVINDFEYAEMREFSGTVRKNLRALPAVATTPRLARESGALERMIMAKESPDAVAKAARTLAASLLEAYPVPLAPRSAPDLARGAALYRTQCAACHGAGGAGDGPAAAGMDPPPIAFTDRERAGQRSLFALEQVIAQGLDGTAMPGFRDLPQQDRWALAFHVGTLAYSQADAREGEALWQADPALRQKIPDLKTLASLTPQALAADIDNPQAAALMAYLRANPEALEPSDAGSLALTRTRLAQSVAAYRKGDQSEAKRLALSAYLDGFEPVEPILAARDGALMGQIERAMGELRAAIGRGAPAADVEAHAQRLDALFTRAEETLEAPAAGGIASFVSALTILLREGIEALLIVVAMVAFLRKSERQDALPYVHGGWIAALAAGLLTWIVATRFIAISGASRELTEGFGGILAALVLVSVGIWMHGKSHADAWQQYIQKTMGKALTKGSAWFLFALAFLVVYREAFETILFYAAMLAEGSNTAVVAGAGVGAVLLLAIAWVMMRYSVRLPIREFFRYSSIVIAVLAVILIGKGSAALQEAGIVGVTPVDWVPRIDVIGLYPTMQVIAAQALVALVLIAGFWINGRAADRLAAQRAG
ncbi:MAG: iron permease [Erythrobacter sp.]|nr:iron permease [Erythrobacter sp.]